MPYPAPAGHDHMEDIDAQLVVILASISLVVNIIKVAQLGLDSVGY